MAQTNPITLNEANDEEVICFVTTNRNTDGTVANPPIPLNLTGVSLEAYLKIGPKTLDSDGSTWKGTSTAGDIVVMDAVAGKVAVNIPGTAISTSMAWWRLDTISSGKRKTAMGGTVTVNDW